jgi:hypothetical protein
LINRLRCAVTQIDVAQQRESTSGPSMTSQVIDTMIRGAHKCCHPTAKRFIETGRAKAAVVFSRSSAGKMARIVSAQRPGGTDDSPIR